MRYTAIATAGVLVLLVASAVTFGAAKPPSPTGTIKLVHDSVGAAKSRTPAWVTRANRFSIGSSSTRGIKVAGVTVKTSVRVSGKNLYLGFDSNGDGTIAKNEWKMIPRSKTMLLRGKTGDKSYTIRLMDMVTNYNKKTVTCWGQALIRSSMKGTLANTTVRLLDDNMDGKFTQTAAQAGDAILIGRSTVAIPLRSIHRIGRNFYRLKVASDGSSIDYERMDDTTVGEVRAIFPANTLKSLVLVGKDSAFDVKIDGKAGIPAGTYSLLYGIVSRSAATLTFRPGRETPKYEITGDMINTLRIGKPIRVNFNASYSKGKIELSAGGVSIVGSGSEIYGPLNFNRDGNLRLPQVTILNGRRPVSSSNMKYG
ncbi:MAG: hypothetical protein GY794_05025 [bacterium]|nr:hypothetical protein [bacterium]